MASRSNFHGSETSREFSLKTMVMRFSVSKGVQPGVPSLAKFTQAACMAAASAGGGLSPRLRLETSTVLNTKGTSQLCAAPNSAPDLPFTGLFQPKE